MSGSLIEILVRSFVSSFGADRKGASRFSSCISGPLWIGLFIYLFLRKILLGAAKVLKSFDLKMQMSVFGRFPRLADHPFCKSLVAENQGPGILCWARQFDCFARVQPTIAIDCTVATGIIVSATRIDAITTPTQSIADFVSSQGWIS